MDNSEKFYNITDLYRRLLPALKTKIDELKKNKINDIKELDIWEYCKVHIWQRKTDLRIYEMVNDILFVDELELIKFVREKLK